MHPYAGPLCGAGVLPGLLPGLAQGPPQYDPPSVSQIIEALFKLIVGLTLAWYLIRKLSKPDYTGAATPLWASRSPSWSLCSIWCGTSGAPAGANLPAPSERPAPPSRSSALAWLSPFRLSDQRLHQHHHRRGQQPGHAGRLQGALNMTEEAARSLMGNYTGVQTVYQIPAALMVAITASVIPAVTVCFTKKTAPAPPRSWAAHLRPPPSSPCPPAWA